MTIATDRRFETRPIQGATPFSADAETAARNWLKGLGDITTDSPVRAHPMFPSQAGGVDMFAHHLQLLLNSLGCSSSVSPAKDNESVIVVAAAKDLMTARSQIG